MGDPSHPTTQRAETRRLASAIVESVRNDEEMPVPPSLESLRPGDRADVEAWLFDLAQELCRVTGELNEALDAWQGWTETETQYPTFESDPGWRRIQELRKPQP